MLDPDSCYGGWGSHLYIIFSLIKSFSSWRAYRLDPVRGSSGLLRFTKIEDNVLLRAAHSSG